MGFDCGIYKYKKMSFGSVSDPENYKLHGIIMPVIKGYPVKEDEKVKVTDAIIDEAQSKSVVDEYGEAHLYTEVETWCSDGHIWFDKMRYEFVGLNIPNSSEEVYVFTKENIGGFINFVTELFDSLDFDVYFPERAMIYTDQDECDEYISKHINGVELSNREQNRVDIWSFGYGAGMSAHPCEPFEFNSYMRLFKAVMSLATVDWDTEEVVVSGGW